MKEEGRNWILRSPFIYSIIPRVRHGHIEGRKWGDVLACYFGPVTRFKNFNTIVSPCQCSATTNEEGAGGDIRVAPMPHLGFLTITYYYVSLRMK